MFNIWFCFFSRVKRITFNDFMFICSLCVLKLVTYILKKKFYWLILACKLPPHRRVSSALFLLRCVVCLTLGCYWIMQCVCALLKGSLNKWCWSDEADIHTPASSRWFIDWDTVKDTCRTRKSCHTCEVFSLSKWIDCSNYFFLAAVKYLIYINIYNGFVCRCYLVSSG